MWCGERFLSVGLYWGSAEGVCPSTEKKFFFCENDAIKFCNGEIHFSLVPSGYTLLVVDMFKLCYRCWTDVCVCVQTSISESVVYLTHCSCSFCYDSTNHTARAYVWRPSSNGRWSLSFCWSTVLSVLWYCWLGLLTCKNRLPYNLYCVGGDVKHCSIQSNQILVYCFLDMHGVCFYFFRCRVSMKKSCR